MALTTGCSPPFPHPGVLLAPLMTQEAVLSSRIEGTQATMGEVLQFEAGQEVDSLTSVVATLKKYETTAAMRNVEKMLETLPLSVRVSAKRIAYCFPGCVGGTNLQVSVSNWKCAIEAATFVPIGAEKLDGIWERYIHQRPICWCRRPFCTPSSKPCTLSCRLMLVPLFLWQRGLMPSHVLHHAYFEAHRDEYYDGLLTKIGRAGANSEAASAGRGQSGDANHEDMKITRSHYAVHALDWIFERLHRRSGGHSEIYGAAGSGRRRSE